MEAARVSGTVASVGKQSQLGAWVPRSGTELRRMPEGCQTFQNCVWPPLSWESCQWKEGSCETNGTAPPKQRFWRRHFWMVPRITPSKFTPSGQGLGLSAPQSTPRPLLCDPVVGPGPTPQTRDSPEVAPCAGQREESGCRERSRSPWLETGWRLS